jgi:bacterioferritin B
MQVSKKLVDAINQQIGNEMGASLQYVAIAAYFDTEALDQLAQFFYRQAEEERDHAMKFVKFLVDVDAEVDIPDIPAPKGSFKTAEQAVQLSLDWEREVTQQIYGLVEIAQEDKDFIALRFLDWFVNEQLEEVTLMGALLSVVRRAGENGLLHVEDYLARSGGMPPVGETPGE